MHALQHITNDLPAPLSNQEPAASLPTQHSRNIDYSQQLRSTTALIDYGHRQRSTSTVNFYSQQQWQTTTLNDNGK
jgi:leucyl-tRNA synthetase